MGREERKSCKVLRLWRVSPEPSSHGSHLVGTSIAVSNTRTRTWAPTGRTGWKAEGSRLGGCYYNPGLS